MNNQKIRSTMALLLGIATLTTTAQAGVDVGKVSTEATPLIETTEPWSWKNLSDYAVLYKNKENPYIQEFALQGRSHGQYYFVDSNQGDHEGWNNRRRRVGFKAKLFNRVKFSTNWNLNTSNDITEGKFIDSIYDVVLSLDLGHDQELSLGKIKPEFSQEYGTSSKRILTFERSLLVNQIVPDALWGGQLDGKLGEYSYKLGLFSGAVDEDNLDFPDFDSGLVYFGSIGYAATDATDVRLDYLYNDGDDRNNAAAPYSHSFSLNSTSDFGKWGLNTDLLYAIGDDVSDAYGLVVMPWVDLIEDKLRLVFRYHFAKSDGDNGLRLQKRYERTVDELISDRGDTYHSAYLGLNYYLNGDKLKLMSGVEYSNMSGGAKDFEGWTWFNGVRMYF